MKVWVLHDDNQDGTICGIHGVTSHPAVAKLWEAEYEYSRRKSSSLMTRGRSPTSSK
jgi:hypothetical protein